MRAEVFTAPRICELANISYRQLDYWIRTGLIHPSVADASGSGSRRLFSAKDLRLICLIKSMLQGGIHLQVVRKVLENFPETPKSGTTIIVRAKVTDLGLVGPQGSRMSVENEEVIVTTSDKDILRIISEGPCWVYKL